MGLKKGLKLMWLDTGKEDSLIPTTRSTVDLMKKHGFTGAYEESPGPHIVDRFRPTTFSVDWRDWTLPAVP